MTRLFLRGFLIVALTATNVRLIAQVRYLPAFMCGFLLSAVWWDNARAAQTPGRYAREVYACGAACGTVVGLWLGGRL
jgi:hypothetical protein